MSNARNLARSATVAGGLAPTGVVLPFAGSAAPSGWLLCYGQAVSRATYADLFAAIGTAYGVGDGSTTFNLPDMRGRVPGGLDNMGGTAAGRLTTAGSGVDGTALGAAGGAQGVTLDTTQIPAHRHNLLANGNASATPVGLSDGGSRTVMGNTNNASQGYIDAAPSVPGTPYVQNTGGGASHNNTQPTIVLNYIIKA